MKTTYRNLPSVNRVLSNPAVVQLLGNHSRDAVVALVRGYLQEVRTALAGGGDAPGFQQIIEGIVAEATDLWRDHPIPVINGTGVILHTNLGRAPLSLDAQQAMLQTGRSYVDLELDLASGKRGSRQDHVRKLLCQLTGAEDALVVNNNAAAVCLGLIGLASGREVIISRGEAVEIGGGFRVPDFLRHSGASLIEVGTTNRTYIDDYEAAIGERTAAILRVHTSNFRISGFTHTPSTAELVELGDRYNLPVLHDLGSGCLLDTRQFGLAFEPRPQEVMTDGVALAFISGDKLLGGPQAGIVIGQRAFVRTLASHPMARTFRIDRVNLAALMATLLHYIRGEAIQKVPIWSMIVARVEELKVRAENWQKVVGGESKVVPSLSTIGGGSLPGETLPTWVLSLPHPYPEVLAHNLRQGRFPVIGRIDEGQLCLDPRTVLPAEEETMLQAVKESYG